MKWTMVFMLLFMIGCAAPHTKTKTEDVWVKHGASQQDFYKESGQCKAQAFSAPGMHPVKVAIIYDACMQGKGWSLKKRTAQ